MTQVLEAAHLQPYRGQHTNAVTNGLLLRADMHTLLDYKLWAPDPVTRTVVISKSLVGTEYNELFGKKIAEPVNPEERPAASVLEKVWKEFTQAVGGTSVKLLGGNNLCNSLLHKLLPPSNVTRLLSASSLRSGRGASSTWRHSMAPRSTTGPRRSPGGSAWTWP